jgi:hypothetical protein
MKTNKITTGILAIALLVGMSFTASAQRGQGMPVKGKWVRESIEIVQWPIVLILI